MKKKNGRIIVRKVNQLKQIHWNNMVLFGGIMGIMYLIALLFLLVFDALREGSTSYITDVFGKPVQYIEYLPFGEIET
ncbi:hypothetical protein [Myroides odoratus]|uniref:hypothetical protein n=1 Tax=Myroides odoratus TaxID=256 RepID=UPI003341BA49